MIKSWRQTSKLAAAVCWFMTAASAATAEMPVGLEAQGVDPWASLHNTQKLDVRDELGRPVSASVIESQMKAIAVEKAADDTYASRLAEARGVVRWVELLAAVFAWLKP